MDDRDFDIDDISDTSEASFSESTSSIEGGIFKPHLPFVLELHDIRKDDPSMPVLTPTDGVGPTVTKIKKQKRKKKAAHGVMDKSRSSLSSDSPSEASFMAPSGAEVKEEFYDAHESYHAIPENQIPLAVRMATQSDTNQDPKAPGLAASSEPHATTPDTQKEPSPVIKPTAPP